MIYIITLCVLTPVLVTILWCLIKGANDDNEPTRGGPD